MFDWSMVAAVAVAALGTSFLSGIFGMIGGLVLMGVLLLFLPVPAAMTLHAITQMTANGWRAACVARARHVARAARLSAGERHRLRPAGPGPVFAAEGLDLSVPRPHAVRGAAAAAGACAGHPPKGRAGAGRLSRDEPACAGGRLRPGARHVLPGAGPGPPPGGRHQGHDPKPGACHQVRLFRIRGGCAVAG